MNFILTRLDEMLQTVQGAVDASALADKASVTVSDDGRDVANAKSLRAGAIIIYPIPEEEAPAPKTSRLTWTIGVVATGESPRDAAERIHALKELLRGVDLFRSKDKATPTDFTLPDQTSIPGYVVSHIEEHRRPQ